MPKFVVRYGTMRILGVFEASDKQSLGRGMKVIARTDRGLETGEILAEATPECLARLEGAPEGQILREMTADDTREFNHIHERRGEQLATCQKCIDKLGLAMELVDLEHLFGGERIVVYYLAEGRVDFRELVRMLAGEFQTRIEMRQIGVRDEAKLLADYGDCGKAVCCNTHLSQMPPVSMKMAKLQKATLDPTKISGRCGRLKCCLRYEFDVYEQLQKELPRPGSWVETPDGRARVLGQEILMGQLWVEGEGGLRRLIDVKDVTPAAPKERPPSKESVPTPDTGDDTDNETNGDASEPSD